MKRVIRFLFRTFMYLTLLGAIVGGLVWSFWPQPLAVEFASVTRGPLRVTVDEDGKTRIRERYVVSTPLAGRLLRIDPEPGDSVLGTLAVSKTDSWLQSLFVLGRATGRKVFGAKNAPPTHQLQVGEKFPDFSVVNQDGRRVRMS